MHESSHKVHILHGIKSVLEEFYCLSGLKVNFLKCEIFGSCVYESILGKKKDKQRHLGVLLVDGKLSKWDCKALVDKITCRIQSWTTKFLSFARRLQLISSVIESFANYWCIVISLLKKVNKTVNRLCSSFLYMEGFQ